MVVSGRNSSLGLKRDVVKVGGLSGGIVGRHSTGWTVELEAAGGIGSVELYEGIFCFS